MEWKKLIEEADKYSKLALTKNIDKFGTDFLLNIVTISIERYMVALLYYNKIVPEGDTIDNYVTNLLNVYQLDSELKKKLLLLASTQNICSLEANRPIFKELASLELYRETLEMLQKFVYKSVLV